MMNKQLNEAEYSSLLEVRGLSKSYSDFKLKNVDLTLLPGMIMGFMGRNGAGKSTTIQAIMDLIKPDGGDIRILGMSMTENEVAVKDQVGYVSDTPILNNAWTVERTLKFVRHFYTNWDEQMVSTYLKRFDIPLKKKVANLSKGMKVKFSLILAISHQPKLLLLDEPTSGLDPVIREEVLELLLEFLQDEERSVLFSSHTTSDVEKIADEVTFIDDGHIFISEDKEALLDRYRRIVIFGDGALDVLNQTLLFNCEQTRGGYIGYTDQFAEFQKKAASEWESERLTLEELFVLLTGRKED